MWLVLLLLLMYVSIFMSEQLIATNILWSIILQFIWKPINFFLLYYLVAFFWLDIYTL